MSASEGRASLSNDCLGEERHLGNFNMALLAEGEQPTLGNYKHCPPDGGLKLQLALCSIRVTL